MKEVIRFLNDLWRFKWMVLSILLLLAVMVLSILLLLEVMVYTVADEIVTFLAKLHIIRM